MTNRPSISKRKFRKWITWILSFVALFFVLGSLVLHFDKARTLQLESRSIAFATLTTAIANYKFERGEFPSRLALLFPKYLNPSNIEYLFPYRDKNSKQIPETLRNVTRFDENCDFLYFPESAFTEAGKDLPARILLCERRFPGGPNTVFVTLNNLTNHLYPREKVERLLIDNGRTAISNSY